MIRHLKHIHAVLTGRERLGHMRSPHWSSMRRAHLKSNPLCACCGTKKNVQVHHIKEFSRHPELELVASNLITLCEDGGDGCHRFLGHLQNWKSYNVSVVEDAKQWSQRIKTRPPPLAG